MKSGTARHCFKRFLCGLCVVGTGIASWDLAVLHRRQETRAALEKLGAEIDDEVLFPGQADPRLPQIAFHRRWLGDHAIWGISFPPGTPADLLARFDRDFPETPRAYRVY